jgi:hypothetical protein
MALKVVDAACGIQEGKLVIVVEGASPEEVMSQDARTLALDHAQSLGHARIGINGTSGSYPVDADGNTSEDWNALARNNGIAAYRMDFKLMGGL